MSKSLTTAQYLTAINAELATATSIASVTKIARRARATVRLSRVPCGYRIARATVDFTDSDLAWFRAPLATTEGK